MRSASRSFSVMLRFSFTIVFRSSTGLERSSAEVSMEKLLSTSVPSCGCVDAGRGETTGQRSIGEWEGGGGSAGEGGARAGGWARGVGARVGARNGGGIRWSARGAEKRSRCARECARKCGECRAGDAAASRSTSQCGMRTHSLRFASSSRYCRPFWMNEMRAPGGSSVPCAMDVFAMKDS